MSGEKIALFGLIGVLLLVAVYAAGKNSPSGEERSAATTTLDRVDGVVDEKLDKLLNEIVNNRRNIEAISLWCREAIAALNEKVDSLREQPTVQLNSSDDNAESNENSYEEMSREFEQNILREQAVYENETIDLNWAPQAEANLESGLNNLAQQLKFELISSECHTTRCAATVVFDNYELASKYGNRLAEVILPGLNCAQSIFFPPPDDTSERYQTNLLLDCTQQILGNVQPGY